LLLKGAVSSYFLTLQSTFTLIRLSIYSSLNIFYQVIMELRLDNSRKLIQLLYLKSAALIFISPSPFLDDWNYI